MVLTYEALVLCEEFLYEQSPKHALGAYAR